jgi:glycerol-3-phosphate cytidylyltransferase
MTKKIIGYTTGVFDLFHIGHLNILRKAKNECDELIVGVTTDELTEKLKGKKPIITYLERAEILENLKCVNKVVPQKEINELKDQENLKFDIMFKGSDWKGTEKWNKLEEEFRKRGVKVIFFPYTQTTSSTVIRKVLYEKLEEMKKIS